MNPLASLMKRGNLLPLYEVIISSIKFYRFFDPLLTSPCYGYIYGHSTVG